MQWHFVSHFNSEIKSLQYNNHIQATFLPFPFKGIISGKRELFDFFLIKWL